MNVYILHKVLKRYLNYKENNKDVEKIQHVFDTIFLIGDTNFILEVMPILTYYDLDTSKNKRYLELDNTKK